MSEKCMILASVWPEGISEWAQLGGNWRSQSVEAWESAIIAWKIAPISSITNQFSSKASLPIMTFQFFGQMQHFARIKLWFLTNNLFISGLPQCDIFSFLWPMFKSHICPNLGQFWSILDRFEPLFKPKIKSNFPWPEMREYITLCLQYILVNQSP